MFCSILNKIANNFNNFFCHNIHESQARSKVIEKATEIIKQHFFIDSDKVASELLERLIDSNNLKNVESTKLLNKITKAISRVKAFGSIPQAYKDDPKFKRGEDVKNFVKLLYTNIGVSPTLISIDLIKALLFKKNKKFLSEVLDEFQRIAQKVVEELKSKENPTAEQIFLVETFIGNLLAITPFLEPDHGQTIKFPQYINGEWQTISYNVTRIKLTPEELGDPLYAYGLFNQSIKSAPPLALFMGTPPPTTTGAELAEWVDFPPGYAVGEIVFDYAKDQLLSWIDHVNQHSEKKVQLYGQSLGGILGLICASTFPDKIGKVFAYNPPAPTPEILERFNANIEGIVPPEINVYHQKNDLIPFIGTGWDKTWNVYKVIPQKKNPSFYFAHIQGFTGQENVLIQKIDTAKDRISTTRLNLNKVFEVVKKPIFTFKTAALKWSIIKKNHTLFSFITRVHNLGIGRLFGMLFSAPSQDKKGSYIQDLLDEVREWRSEVTQTNACKLQG